MPKPSPEARRLILSAVSERRRGTELLERFGLVAPEDRAKAEEQRLRKERIAAQARQLAKV